MEKKRRDVRDLAALFLCIAFALLALWLFLKYLLGLLLPFLLGWTLAFLIRPIASRFGLGSRISNRVLRLLFLLLAIALFALGIGTIGANLIKELHHLLSVLSSGQASFPPALSNLLSRLGSVGEGANVYLKEFANGCIRALSGFLPTIIRWTVASVPRMIFAFVMTLISAVYFCLDLERVNKSMLSLLPPAWQKRAIALKNGIFRVAAKYLRAYLILMAITFTLLLAGFLIMKVEYAVLLAFVISLIDLFPILGVGTVLLPWSLWCFFIGSPSRGLGLLIVWGVALIIRQFSEPRLLGISLGVHPLLTLFAMYTGLRLGGVFGMLLLPALCVPLVSLFRLHKTPPSPGDDISEPTDNADNPP